MSQSVRRIRKSNVLYGPTHHLADCQNSTLCGIPINENWSVNNSSKPVESNCRRCNVLKPSPSVREAAFRKDLQAVLDKYDAEITVDERGSNKVEVYINYDPATDAAHVEFQL